MKHSHSFIFLLGFLFSLSPAMEPVFTKNDSVIIKNLLTPINNEKGISEELYSLLRYPSDSFKKTYIFEKTTKQGPLSSITPDNINAISDGFATYHYNLKLKKSWTTPANSGAIVINKDKNYTAKGPQYLQEERNEICKAILIKKIEKSIKTTQNNDSSIVVD